MLNISGSGNCNEAEKSKDEYFTEPRISIRVRSSGVEPRGCDCGNAYDDQPPRRHGGQSQTSDRGKRKRGKRGSFDGFRRNKPPAHESRRPNPNTDVIGSSDAVAVVIREVHAELQGERHEERKYGSAPSNIPSSQRGRSSADRYRYHRSGKGSGPSSSEPHPPAGRNRCGALDA